ncbi:MAG: hypothetical protein ABI591_27275 [Kofleriaceae bacterium]
MKSLCALLFLVASACGDNAPECDSSIELVYGPNHHSTGQRLGALAGVQDPTGTNATPTGDGGFAPFATPGTSLKLTPP